MAISAQQSKIPGIRGPISETSRPNVMTVFRPQFFPRINVVYVKRSMIRKSALGTRATEFSDQGEFAPPVAGAFVRRISTLIPVGLLTVLGAKATAAISAALIALSRLRPAMRQVTFLIAVFSSSITDAVGVHLTLFPAMGALDSHCRSSHSTSVPRYFDIACQRIDAAYAQGRLFA